MKEKWYCEIIENLEVAVTDKFLGAQEIYDCLDELGAGYRERLDLVSDILSISMSNLSIGRDEFSQLLKRSILHPISKIRSLALKTILKELEAHAGEDVNLDDGLIMQVLEAVRDDDTAVNARAIAILSICLECKLDQNLVKAALLQAFKGSAIIKCRIFEIAVNLAKRSPETMQKIRFILDEALAELGKNDVLVQVNILKMLPSLARHNFGLLFLEQCDVFEVLSRRVETFAHHPWDRLLIPAIMNFFGNVATSHPQKVITEYPYIISYLFRCMNAGDALILPSAFGVLANLMSTHEGILLMEAKYLIELRHVFRNR